MGLSNLWRGSAILALALGLAIAPAAAQTGTAVTIVVPEQPDNMEICNLGISNIDRVLAANVAEALTRLDPATGDILPSLATAWERTGDLTWTFTLRDGVSFHDGAAFNADAVVAAVNRVMDGVITCQQTTIYFNSVKITAAAIDPMTVEITTSVASPILPTLMLGLFIGSPNGPTDAPATTPIGTGPYQFGEFVQGERVVINRFDGYWGDAPAVTSATYVWRSESSIRAAMVTNGEADISPYISRENANDPATDVTYLNRETSRMRLDPAFEPLSDVRVRRALNLAIDRQALKDAIFGPDVVIAAQLVAPGTLGYNADLEPWPYDPEEARRLIEEARADGVNFDQPFPLVGRNGIYPYAGETIEALLSMWQDIGLTFDVRYLEVADWLAFIQKPTPEDRGANIVQDQHGNSTGDAIVTLNTKYYSGARSSPLTDDVLDGMIEAAQIAEGDDRREQMEEIFKYLQDNVLDIPLFHQVGYARISPRINWTPNVLTANQIILADVAFNE